MIRFLFLLSTISLLILPQEYKFANAYVSVTKQQQHHHTKPLIKHYSFLTTSSTASYHSTRRTKTILSAESSPSTTTSSSARSAINYLKSQPFQTLLPKSDTLSILTELLSDTQLLSDSETLVTNNIQSITRKIQSETRSTSTILGPDTTSRILSTVQNLNEYDAQTVNSFLESDAINALFSRVLYDGIFEFFQKIDVFGNIVNSLPIIGPIRKQIVSETKRQLDRSLGPLVQNFLKTYTKIAVLEASEFVLSAENRKAFGLANVKLVKSVLDRPINTLLPDSATEALDKIKVEVFDYLRKVDVEKDLEGYVDFVYELVGDKSVDRFVNVERVLDASPTLSGRIDVVWERAVRAGERGEEEEEEEGAGI